MKLKRASDGKHKWLAEFSDGTQTKFGAKGMDDYTITHDKQQRDRYRERHKKDLETKNPRKAGFLSYYILWGPSTSIQVNLKKFEAMYGSEL
jgi:hypothetical protein